MNAEQREELRRVADQCICHPLSRGIREVEDAGEAIKSLLDELADTEKAYALLFAENARLRKDAERYRFIRSGLLKWDAATSILNDTPLGIDESVDKAMEAK